MILTKAVDVPTEFVADIVYSILVWIKFGVPVISPVEVSKLSQLEKPGEMLQVATAPPELVGETVPITVSFVRVRLFCV